MHYKIMAWWVKKKKKLVITRKKNRGKNGNKGGENTYLRFNLVFNLRCNRKNLHTLRRISFKKLLLTGIWNSKKKKKRKKKASVCGRSRENFYFQSIINIFKS